MAQNFPDPTLWYYYRGPVEHLVLPPQPNDAASARSAARTLASQGIQDMAERGRKTPLDTEAMQQIAAGRAQNLLSGGNVNPSPGSTSLEFDVTTAYPYVTLVTMIAPSPDWFVGVSALSLLDGDGWRPEVRVDLEPWDAGTDSGVTFESENLETLPHVPIFRIMQKRAVITGSTLRPRAADEKARLAGEVERVVWPWTAAGKVNPQVDATFPLADAAKAHAHLEGGAHVGKIVLTTD